MKTIEWHEECLRNRLKHQKELSIRLNILKIKLEEFTKENRFYAKQIAAAIEKGKDEFDKNKFLRKNNRR